MAAAAGRGEDGREEAARRAEHREGERVLDDGDHGGERRDRDEQHEGLRRGQKVVEPKRGEDDKVEDADPTALQGERVARATLAEPPAEREQHDRAGGHAGESQLDR